MNRSLGTQERRGGGRFSAFTDEQRAILMKYFDEYGMTSTKRCNLDLISRCAEEIGSTVEKIKNWIGSEAVKRKRKAGILPRPKFEFSSGNPELKTATTPPAVKKIKRVNGYNVFFSDYVQNHAELGPDFKERNAIVAQKWAELSDTERKQWAARAEIVCSASIQGLHQQQQQHLGVLNSPSDTDPTLASITGTPSSLQEDNIVEKTLLSIQEKFELLEQLGFEGYSILVNTSALQTHLIATSKGKSYHKLRQQLSKPLENPFIGHVFSDNPDVSSSTITTASLPIIHGSLPQTPSPIKVVRVNVGATPTSLGSSLPPLSTLESMQRSVMNAFALKYKVATGRSEVPYDSIDSLGVQVYGMPPGVPFHSPLLYNQQQLQQILANLEKIVFLKTSTDSTSDTSLEVELSQESMSSLVEKM